MVHLFLDLSRFREMIVPEQGRMKERNEDIWNLGFRIYCILHRPYIGRDLRYTQFP